MSEEQEVEVTIKVKLSLPAEWPKPEPDAGTRGFREPLAKYLADRCYEIADRWKPRTSFWEGDWKRHLEGEVTDVELDAGNWGYEVWTPESDGRLFIEMVMVPK
jgi:hypothetical protein